MRWIWIDRIVELVPRERLVAIKNISLAEDYLHDHFPARPASDGVPARLPLPVMPASLIIEGMAQSAGILVGHAQEFREKVILAKISRARIDLDATPGHTIRYTATLERIDRAGASTTGLIELLDPMGATPPEAIGYVDLIFSHIDQNMAGHEFPAGNFVFDSALMDVLGAAEGSI